MKKTAVNANVSAKNASVSAAALVSAAKMIVVAKTALVSAVSNPFYSPHV